MVGGGADIGMNGWRWLGWLMLTLASRRQLGVLAVGEWLGWLGDGSQLELGLALRWLALVLLLRWLGLGWLRKGWDGWHRGWH